MMKKIMLFSFLISMGSFVPGSSVHAIMIDFDPSVQTINPGDMPTVDIVISGLEEGGIDQIVSAFDLDISFNTSVLAANDVSFGPFLGDPSLFEVLFNSDFISTPGIIDLAGLSFRSDDDLAGLQPDSFVLATLAFTAIGAGTSSLSFVPDPLFGLDVTGRDAEVLDLTAGAGSINVTGTPVPEPPALLLFGIGLLVMSKWWVWRLRVIA